MGELKNCPSRQESKVKSKQGVIEQAQTEVQKQFHCATLMDLCHLKNYGLDQKFQTYKGRVVQVWRRCERRLRLVCCVHQAGIFRVTHDSRYSSVCAFQTSQDAQDKQVMQFRLTLN